MEQTKTKTVKLYVVEEQQIYREVFRSILPSMAPIELLDISGNGDIDALKKQISQLSPDVLLLSIKKLDTDIIKELAQIRTAHPSIGIMLLLVFCNTHDVELLRQLALKGAGGMALFLKQSLDQAEQLGRAILAVSQGQVILDPALASFMFAGKPESPFLKQLTSREMEILNLLAQGFTNAAIAQTLYIDIKTVEHHLNSTYSKLKADPEFSDKHLRVSAAKLYLETMGDLARSEDLLVHATAARR